MSTGHRCSRLTWPMRSDKVPKTERQFAHMQLKDGTEVERGEEGRRCGEKDARDGEEEALERSEKSACMD